MVLLVVFLTSEEREWYVQFCRLNSCLLVFFFFFFFLCIRLMSHLRLLLY